MQITADHLLLAYRNGIFPMAPDRNSAELHWYDPPERGILPLDGFHFPSRLIRTVRQKKFTVTINHDIVGVMQRCGDTRDDTWINADILALYTELHQRGHAHSIEIWQGSQMVGGLYGVSIGAAFCGESMFSTARDASKIALVHLIARLIKRGYQLCDTQFTTPHLAQFGGREIPHDDYHAALTKALQIDCQFMDDLDGTTAGNAVLVASFVAGLSA